MRKAKDVLDLFYSMLTGTPVFKHSFPDNYTSDAFTVINTLGVPKDPIQTVDVNVNVYAKDIDPRRGIPDLVVLDTMAGVVINDLHDYHDAFHYIEFQFMNLQREEALNMHLLNLRFQLTFLNN